MNASDRTPTDEAPDQDATARPRIIELQTKLDDRDETIRLLNEALSRALDELRGERAA